MQFNREFWQEVLDYRKECVENHEPVSIDGIMDEFNLSNRMASGIYTFIDNLEYILEAIEEKMNEYELTNNVNDGKLHVFDTDGKDLGTFKDLVDNYDENLPAETDEELVEAAVKYKKQTQRYADTNRIERKSFREYARVDNALSELDKELTKVLESYSPHAIEVITNKEHADSATDKTSAGIIHLTDLHFNELVDIAVNKYDFKVASKRLRKITLAAIKYFEAEGIESVLIAFTGDILNNDNLLDKILNQASNRAKAVFLSYKLLSQMLDELMPHFQLTIAGVTGNETRIKGDISFDTKVASDNFDFMIYNMLYATYHNCKRISFVSGCESELVVNIAGQNVLMLHGHQRKILSNVTSAVQQIIGKYAQRGIVINFVIFGHLHECYIADLFARGSSMVGANAYSENGLQLASRASQNLHICYIDGSRNSIKVDLQNTDGIVGYEIDEELEAYNSKSVDKLSDNKVIFQVII